MDALWRISALPAIPIGFRMMRTNAAHSQIHDYAVPYGEGTLLRAITANKSNDDNVLPAVSFASSGIHVEIVPTYHDELSDHSKNLYTWTLATTITNTSASRTITLAGRVRIIRDNNGRQFTIKGRRVAGINPIIKPNEKFTYTTGTGFLSNGGTIYTAYLYRYTDSIQTPLLTVRSKTRSLIHLHVVSRHRGRGTPTSITKPSSLSSSDINVLNEYLAPYTHPCRPSAPIRTNEIFHNGNHISYEGQLVVERFLLSTRARYAMEKRYGEPWDFDFSQIGDGLPNIMFDYYSQSNIYIVGPGIDLHNIHICMWPSSEHESVTKHESQHNATPPSVETLRAAFDSLATRLGVSRDQLLEAVLSVDNARPPLPEKARITYAERAKDPALAGLDIIDFLRAEYGPWLDGTLTRPILRRLDPTALRALYNSKSNWETAIYIPTKSASIDKMVARGNVPTELIPQIGQTLERRKQRARKATL